MYLLTLLNKNITYDKISTETELKQFNKNLDLIKQKYPEISKKHL
jgi:hypothetical protein